MFDLVSNLIKKVVGSKSDKDLKEIHPFVDRILEAEGSIVSVSDDELRNKTSEFKSRIADFHDKESKKIESINQDIKGNKSLTIREKEDLYEQIDKLKEDITNKIEDALLDILPEAFAVIKETAKRFKEKTFLEVNATEMDKRIASQRDSVVINGERAKWSRLWNAGGLEISWDMIHYDVQLIGGVALHQGKIAEMATGEGKTLVATLPVYLNALPGRGVHVVTVNNYLAKRDAEWMGPLFEFHGLTIDCIDNHQPHSEDRRKAYQSDITYGTNNEFGFDYLRDNMVGKPDEMVQRPHNYAIVDEVDSVLIDDARTPLIISGPTPQGDKHEFTELKPKIEKLVKAQRNLVTTLLADAKKFLGALENESLDKKTLEKYKTDGGLALFRAFRGLPRNKALIKYLSESGIKAQLQKTENFYLQDNAKEMPKADEELFFVIDEKSNTIELSEKGIDLITDATEHSSLFVLPDMGVEMVEIEKKTIDEQEKLKLKDELIRDYSAKVERVHTINQLLKAYTLFEKDIEYVIMDNKVKIVDEQTGRIMEGRRYSDGLHQAIEAKENVKIEAATQTYATITLQNYFRMYNKLSGMTGTAETEAGEFWEIYKLDVVVIPTNRPISRDDMNDLVFKTKREKYNSVITEIEELKENKRPVLVGTTSVEVSELLSRMLKMKNIDHNVLNAKLHQREADIVAAAGQPGTVTIATNMAGRGTDIKLGNGVKDAGGLAIIGTERHESRRVDRQLRGRSGRQGDPGSSQFFVSLEDDLMRLFGSDRIAKLMDRMGLKEGEVIQHSMISRSIERAQKKVEENNFGIRKRLLEYDDVMNSQREVIYTKRKHALYGERMGVETANAIYDVCEQLAEEYHELRDFEGFKFEMIRVLASDCPLSETEFNQMPTSDLMESTFTHVYKGYQNKCKSVSERTFPVIKQVFENEGASYENIVVPFSDGSKTMQLPINLKEAYENEASDISLALEKSVTLAMIDNSWKEHLREMDDLRQSVQNAVYEQKDPLLIYKFESFELFKLMLQKVNREIVSFLVKANIPITDPSQVKQAQESRTDYSRIRESKQSVPGSSAGTDGRENAPPPKTQPVRVEKKVGRNEPCPCGSGKKFKQCHGKTVFQ